MQRLKILKFGGTSVGRVDRLQSVVEIVGAAAREHRVIVVSSAASGVTDLLVDAADRLKNAPMGGLPVTSSLRVRHFELAAGLLPARILPLYVARMDVLLEELDDLLHDAEGAPATPRLRDAVLAFGERLSMPLVQLGLEAAGVPSVCADASRLVRTDDRHGAARVVRSATNRRVRDWYAGLVPGTVPVVTGFLGATSAGAVTTLGRGGSDYTAALLAAALRAFVFERWTDVDGIYTDDPRIHPDAKRLHTLALDEAWVWNRAGRIGMHRRALDPLVDAGIRIHVRSTGAPDHPGTVILPRTPLARAAAG